jgi:regulator of cell morphogenesis and NO signaling
MTSVLNEQATVATIATSVPRGARVFERFGIDYCCGGKLPLESACRRRGLNTEEVLDALRAAAAESPAGERDWNTASLAELADHIESVHHHFLTEELPRVRALATKVARVHGENHPELREVAEVFVAFADEMFSHMRKEEGVLFPAIRAIERGESGAPGASIDAPIACMVHEHDDAGRSLERMRALTGDFRPPAEACNSWRVLVNDLARLERDTHAHVHKENNILFPRALALAGASRRS